MAVVFGAIKGFIVSCLAFVFSFSQVIAPVGALISPKKDAFFEDWNKEQSFVETYAARVDKKADKDFVILNLTDIQLSFPNAYSNEGEYSEKTIDKLIREKEPDLITVTGDNAWSITTYLRFIKFLDSYGIPWAPVMGNHDGQGCIDEFFCAYWLAGAKNCLFKFGPKDMGYGNYIINIYQNGKIIHTLFMMDSHSDSHDTAASLINAGSGDGGYDHFWLNQLDWYEWAVNGIKELNGGETVESTVFMHIPCIEYRIAQAECAEKVVTGVDESGKETYYYCAKNEGDFGENHEWICSPEANNGFFALCKELGSTKNMIAGHDHVNSMSIMYEGIRLSYGIKCGSGCYWEKTMSGGTLMSINEKGENFNIHHEYIEF